MSFALLFTTFDCIWKTQIKKDFSFQSQPNIIKDVVKVGQKLAFILQKFLIDPKANYSMLMFIIEQELGKFPKRSYYGQQLQILFQLLEAGPVFTQKPHFYL